MRKLWLDASRIAAIVAILKEEKKLKSDFLTSTNLSYSALLGNEGAAAIIKSLPAPISEIGLVHCGIGDQGGVEVLKWMKKTTSLNIICLEQNNFSETLKLKF